ncbi:MAG: hypothetical protein QG670_298 [Thermoproteota archaeon]|nr:hypothetical protein [Thermoproteota archaeon]
MDIHKHQFSGKRFSNPMNLGIVMYQTSFTKGQELVAQKMARELVKQGHKAFLITGPFHDNELVTEHDMIERSTDGYVLFRKSDFEVPLVRVDGYISSWPPRRIMFKDFVSVLRRLVDRFKLDVIISHSTLWNGPEEIIKFITWKKMLKEQGLDREGILYACMPHYQPPDPIQYNIIERAYRVTWNNMVFPQIFNSARLVLCTTPLEINQMIELGANKRQCHMYSCGLDEEPYEKYWSNESSDFFKTHSIPTDAKIITYLGTIEERKNPLAVVRIARMLQNLKVHFVIAGQPSSQDKAVKEEAKGLENLSYIGRVTEEEKIMLIKSSYVNILMSRMEAFGITQLEFMYGGVPIITSAIGGQGWLIRDGIDGIHVKGPNDLESAKNAVETLVKNNELHDKYALNAKERAKEFTLSRIVSDLISKLTPFTTS